MPTLDNDAFATQFTADVAGSLVTAGVITSGQQAALAAALGPLLQALLPQWNDGAVSRTALASALSGQIDATNAWQAQLAAWWTGTLTGGATDDTGATTPGGPWYPFTDKFGVTTWQMCPAGMLNSVTVAASAPTAQEVGTPAGWTVADDGSGNLAFKKGGTLIATLTAAAGLTNEV